jgi:RES domain-containing protein
MQIWRLCRAVYAADAFSGEGSRLYGGRWNSPGVPLVYSSTSLALAAIELFVHVEPRFIPRDLVSISAELPQGEPAQRWEIDQLPTSWSSDELQPIRALGDRWARSKQALAVLVPAVPIRGEWNVLVNPLHPRIGEIKVHESRPFAFDERMFHA